MFQNRNVQPCDIFRGAVAVGFPGEVNISNRIKLFAAFLHYTAKGLSPIDALTRAEIFAAVKIGVSGASKGFCTEQEIESRLSSADISILEL